MNALALIALLNVILWGAAFGVLWWVARSEAALETQIRALEERFKREA